MSSTGKITIAIATAVVLSMQTPAGAAAAAWKCGKKHCFWTQGYTGPVPEFASQWGAPSGPGCYYVLRANTKWVEYCPSTRPMQ